MFKRGLFATIAAIVLFSCVAATALAWPGVVEKAPDLTMDSTVGYYIWHNDDGFHLRTHGPGDDHGFVFVLTTDGVFNDVDTVRLESADSYRLLAGGHVMVGRFHTYNYTDGLNFRIAGGTHVRFRLLLDGSLIPTDQIFLGAGLEHPAHNPFVIRR